MKEPMKLTRITEGKPIHRVRNIKSLKDMLSQSVELYGLRTAFKYRRNPQEEVEVRTFQAFSRDVDAFGTALAHEGFSNCRIAIIGENRYEWVVAYIATVNGLGVAVPLDKMLPPNEIQLMLDRGEIDVLVYSESFHDTILKLSETNSQVRAFICMNPTEKTTLPERFLNFDGLLQKGEALLAEGSKLYTHKEIDSDIMAVLLFTSGTSAGSKAVMLSHTNLCADLMGVGGVFHAEPGESLLSVLPLHHTFENTAGLLYPLYHGMTVAIGDGLKYLSKNMLEHKPDIMIGVPLIYEKFMGRVMEEVRKKGMTRKVGALMMLADFAAYLGLDFRKKAFARLRDGFGGKLRGIISGGAPLEAHVAKWYEGVGIKVYQGYGLTETSPIIAGCNDRVRKVGTCGEPLPGMTLAIANPDPLGTGEIVVRGKTVMLGYWKNEEATGEAIENGWFKTGDLGRITKKGILEVTGRVKSMIVLKNGKKVFPEELETHINKVEYIRESLVWGEASPDGDVEICAKIVLDKDKIYEILPDGYLAEDHEATESEIKKLLDKAIKDINKLMPQYKNIKHYLFGYNELIKTTSLKIKRYVEMDTMHKAFSHLATSVKNAAGKNVDKLIELFYQKAGSNT